MLSTVAEYRESPMTQCVMHANATTHTTRLVVFQGYSAMIIALGRVLKRATRVLYPSNPAYTQNTAKAYTYCTCRGMTVVRSYLVLPPTVIKALSASLIMLSHSSNDGRVWMGRRLRSVSLDFRNALRITSSS